VNAFFSKAIVKPPSVEKGLFTPWAIKAESDTVGNKHRKKPTNSDD